MLVLRSRHAATWFRPDIIFAIIALFGGALLIAMIPPGTGGNENFNFQRASGIAHGQLLIRPVDVPGGIVAFLEETNRRIPEGSKPPLHYDRADFDAVAAIPLAADEPQTLKPNPIAVLHPFSYLPQVPALWLGEALGLSPVALLYLGRAAGLLVGVGLLVLAIRAMPFHAGTLAAVALLPTSLYSRSIFDADQLTTPLAFLLMAQVLRESMAKGPISSRTLGWLAVGAFILCQTKSAYLLLPLAALLIPTERFASPRSRLAALALIILPGLVGSLGWMLALKADYFSAIRYMTWSGLVDPDAQLQRILSAPLGYADVLAATAVSAPFLAALLLGPVMVFGPSALVPIPWLLPLFFAFAAVVICQPKHARPAAPATRLLVLGIAAATLGLILTLLYLQWTAVGGPVVHGFQGRYLLPLAPLLLIFLPEGGRMRFGLSGNGWLAVTGLLSLAAISLTTWQIMTAPGSPFVFLP